MYEDQLQGTDAKRSMRLRSLPLFLNRFGKNKREVKESAPGEQKFADCLLEYLIVEKQKMMINIHVRILFLSFLHLISIKLLCRILVNNLEKNQKIVFKLRKTKRSNQ